MKTSIIRITLYWVARKVMLLFFSLAFTAFITSCNNDEDAAPKVSSEDQETIGFETSESYYFEDSEDVAMEAFTKEDENGNGKMALDARLSGAVIIRTGTLLDGR